MFIGKEIKFLEKYFDIEIAPILISNKKELISGSVKIDNSLNTEIKKNKIYRAFRIFSSFKFYIELIRAIKLKKTPSIKATIQYIDLFNSSKKWLNKDNRLTKYDVIYTYWLTAVTAAVVAQKKRPLTISRVHGYDLYEERYKNYYIIGIRETLQKLDILYTISNHAIKYIKQYYNYNCKIELARLGVEAQICQDGNLPKKLYLVSCSSVILLKRVQNLLKVVLKVAYDNPNLEIKWTHIGDGDEMQNIKNKLLNSKLAKNLNINLLGNLNNEEVITYYKNTKVDLFIHASETEGLPVSMQEAHSFGIPIISTNVGGVSEIVVEGTGFLVNLENTVEELKDRINEYINFCNQNKFRLAAHKNQLINFNIDNNYTKFALNIFENCSN